MFKKLLIFSTMTIIGGCETINQANQCDPEKNYAISNPEAMEEYKRLKNKGDIKGYYFNNLDVRYCNDSLCVFFDTRKFEYMEFYFNDENRKGIYTVKEVIKNKDCIHQNPAMKNNLDKKCFVAVKNNNEEILSRYEYKTYKKENRVVIIFYDRAKNVKVYEESHQIYSTKAIGAPGFGVCKKAIKETFSPNSFPSQ